MHKLCQICRNFIGFLHHKKKEVWPCKKWTLTTQVTVPNTSGRSWWCRGRSKGKGWDVARCHGMMARFVFCLRVAFCSFLQLSFKFLDFYAHRKNIEPKGIKHVGLTNQHQAISEILSVWFVIVVLRCFARTKVGSLGCCFCPGLSCGLDVPPYIGCVIRAIVTKSSSLTSRGS